MYKIQPPEEIAVDLAKLRRSMQFNYDLIVEYVNDHGWEGHNKEKLSNLIFDILKQINELDTLGNQSVLSVYSEKTLLYRVGKRMKAIGEEMIRLDAYIMDNGKSFDAESRVHG